MTLDDPFATLAIAPTLDLALIKRAYFAALAKTPPHVDREGFRRLRSAYETLTDARTRNLAFLRAPADAATELARFEAEWGERINAASAEARLERERSQAVDRFLRRVVATSFDELVGSAPQR